MDKLIIGCTIGTWLAVMLFWWLIGWHNKAMQEHRKAMKDFCDCGELGENK